MKRSDGAFFLIKLDNVLKIQDKIFDLSQIEKFAYALTKSCNHFSLQKQRRMNSSFLITGVYF